MSVWKEEFGSSYHVPKSIEDLVRTRTLAETSWHADVSPSFSARIPGGDWIRLWVEHPDRRHRRSGGRRFAVDRTKELSKAGTLLAETDRLDEILAVLARILDEAGVQSRFRLLGAGDEAAFSWKRGDLEFRVEKIGAPYKEPPLEWQDFAVVILAPGLEPVRLVRRELSPDPDILETAAEETMISLVHAFSDPGAYVENEARAAKEGEKEKVRRAAEEAVAIALHLGDRLVRARRDWLRRKGLTPGFSRGPKEWLPPE